MSNIIEQLINELNEQMNDSNQNLNKIQNQNVLLMLKDNLPETYFKKIGAIANTEYNSKFESISFDVVIKGETKSFSHLAKERMSEEMTLKVMAMLFSEISIFIGEHCTDEENSEAILELILK